MIYKWIIEYFIFLINCLIFLTIYQKIQKME